MTNNQKTWQPVLESLGIGINDSPFYSNYAAHHDSLVGKDPAADKLLIPTALLALTVGPAGFSYYVTDRKLDVYTYAHMLNPVLMEFLTTTERARYLKEERLVALRRLLHDAMSVQAKQMQNATSILFYNACTAIEEHTSNTINPYILYSCQLKVV